MGVWKPAWDPRSFDPVRLGHQETDAWAAYYRHDWSTFLRSAVQMVRTGFGTDPVRTVTGAYHVLRANQLWAPYPDNDPGGARGQMRQFYAMVTDHLGLDLDAERAAALEVEWWRLHREHQHDPSVSEEALVGALVALYSYVYAVPGGVRPRRRQVSGRGDGSLRCVGGGRLRPRRPPAGERAPALVASHSALRRAVGRE